MAGIVDAHPVVSVALDRWDAVVFGQHRVHEGVVAIDKVQDRSIILNGVFDVVDGFLEHGFAQIAVELGEALTIDRVVGFKETEVEPVAGELRGQATYPGILHHAAANDLQKPSVLLAQTRRMMKDSRTSGLATEFTGNWLAFRLFETNNAVDRQRFPQFNNDLREAMFQEPIRYVEDTIQNNGSVLDLIYGNYTFVNPVLAKHYGIPGVQGDADHWVRVDNAGQYGRGGILPMSVFMTQNSPGLRTSPVKRGNWVVQKVLGIRVPPPPPVVPELPSDESKSDLPVRDMLARHRAVPFCAACHQRFDSFGLAYEGYGPIGDVRTKDLAGRPVDTAVTYPGGVNGTGFEGLRDFIRDHRQDQFINNLCRKLLSYSLNRTLQLSDEALVDTMQTNLAKQGYGFDSLVETIVLSPQFRNKRIPAPQRPETQLASRKGN